MRSRRILRAARPTLAIRPTPQQACLPAGAAA